MWSVARYHHASSKDKRQEKLNKKKNTSVACSGVQEWHGTNCYLIILSVRFRVSKCHTQSWIDLKNKIKLYKCYITEWYKCSSQNWLNIYDNGWEQKKKYIKFMEKERRFVNWWGRSFNLMHARVWFASATTALVTFILVEARRPSMVTLIESVLDLTAALVQRLLCRESWIFIAKHLSSTPIPKEQFQYLYNSLCMSP